MMLNEIASQYRLCLRRVQKRLEFRRQRLYDLDFTGHIHNKWPMLKL